MQKLNLEQLTDLTQTGSWVPDLQEVPAQNLNSTEKPDVKSNEGGLKLDYGKPNLALLPSEALLEIAKVLDFGAKKYTAHNWRKGFLYSRVASATLRHLYAWLRGEDNDPESGLSHLAHAGCNILFLITFVVTKTGKEDRYINEKN